MIGYFHSPLSRYVLLACLLSAWPAAIGAAGPSAENPAETVERYGDIVSVFGGDIRIPAGVRHNDDVVCIGGNVFIEGEVRGDVTVVLGSLELSGSIRGALTGVLSDLHLRQAHVSGELVNVLGPLEMESSSVSQDFINILGTLTRDELSSRPTVNVGIGSWFPDFWTLATYLRMLHKLLIFVLLLLLVAVVPDRVRRIGEEAPVRYLPAFFVGLLGYLGALIVFGLLSATVVGIPLAAIAFYVLKWLGIAGIFLAVGRRLGRSFGREMSILGAVLLTFAIYTVLIMAPSLLGLPGLLFLGCFWILFFLLVELPAIGLVILTVAGGRIPPDRSGPGDGGPPVPRTPPPAGPLAPPVAPTPEVEPPSAEPSGSPPGRPPAADPPARSG